MKFTNTTHFKVIVEDFTLVGMLVAVALLFGGMHIPYELLQQICMSVGALMAMASSDAILFGKVLRWMRADRGEAQPLLEHVVALYNTNPELKTNLERATSAYRVFQHVFNWSLILMVFHLCGLAPAVGLIVATWCGTHDDLYHLLMKHRLKWGGKAPEPWKWWTPWGLLLLLRREVPTSGANVIQAVFGAIIMLAACLI